MLRIRVLGKGLIPRINTIAPRMDPFPADPNLVALIMSTPGLKVEFENPDNGKFVPITRDNYRQVIRDYNGKKPAPVAPAPEVPHAPETPKPQVPPPGNPPVPEKSQVPPPPPARIEIPAEIQESETIEFNVKGEPPKEETIEPELTIPVKTKEDEASEVKPETSDLDSIQPKLRDDQFRQKPQGGQKGNYQNNQYRK